jgi:hypothetical protein
MTFPTSTIVTTHLDAGSDDPSLARADILDAVTKLNSIITDKNTPNGVVVLDSTGKITFSLLPDTISSSTGSNLTLNPSTGIVKLQNYLRLQTVPKATLTTVVGNYGDIALCSNADSGNPALAFSNGVNWYYLPLASLTLIS